MEFKVLRAITRIGTRHLDNADDEEDIILSNKVSMLMSTLPLIYIFANVYDQGWSRITLPILLQPFLFLIPVLVNGLGYTTFSRVLLSWNMPLQALIFSIYNKSSGIDFQTSHYIGIQFSIMASSVVPFLLFRLEDTFLMLFSLAGPFLALTCFDLVHNFFGVGYHQKGLSESGYALTKMRVLIGFIIITGSALFLKRSVGKKEHVNKGLIADLEEKNREILGQLEEISAQNEFISLQNNQLEEQKRTIESQYHLLQMAKSDLEKKVKEKTADILQASQELEKQYLQLEQFAFMAAHNLRGPVARILGLLQLLQFPETDPLEKEKVMTLIGSSILDLDEVIRDLVSVVQVKYQNADNNKKLKASDIMRKVLSQLQQDLDSQGIVISNQINPQHEIAVNDAFAHSILHNIISNSIKYKDVSKTPHIFLRSEVNETECILEITDNGIGFDSEAHRDKLFKPFSRLNTRFSGKGLGLYLAKVQVESAGGHIFARSKVNEGTTIRLQFPTGAAMTSPN
ncbi:sensor histidine kinase [Chryseolinea soli]|uniref:histidine kinase n=1 Tax=Chryseolinea soli TaxID=2321403 RepID=A0A385SD05_9BACT|nr:HAMP domain-containing sensor histidine kinase [Chryseolinea soli]AYB29099.1 hypothetical protein D4L85_00215 [Chryseolinea soli]